ncbi:MAG TPA: heavy-metal-associated domain-containing protein [Chloroflexota bacterium]|nr:heavy-metal-associated domain-containing protein [Chloroflexota bacterium]
MATAVLTVPDISCEHCEHTITQALSPVEGITSVRVDIPEKKVQVDYDASQVDVERMKAILADEDYPVESAV